MPPSEGPASRRRTAARLLAEFAVVFLGVSLSFLAEDARENRRDRRDEVASLERLRQDLEESDFDVELGRAERSFAAGNRILAARDSTPPTADSLSAWLSEAVLCTNVIAIRSEWNSLRSSGGLDLLRDSELRQLLSAHYERYDPVLALGAIDCESRFTRPIAASLSLAYGSGAGPVITVTGDVARIMSNPDFVLELAYALSTKSYLVARYTTMDGQRKNLLERIDAALQR